ncbi:ADP-ribosyltransferase [Pseudoalteromonas maricaloris]|uniref:ADP-ribosyltransferase n=1 Tax=Pseudoalteromonas maricaloris TaxID=184924 RepID=UPI00057FCF84|nr:ADP-ribosyltransferase [Pseudoalteromonas flavipulchra]KID33382.1 hypothetical protein QT15_23465 [Pseudoalteromonas flavipulchra NCIMB 2033 = ATCC BAA-314]MBD0781923.1 hypothetical protein [Pseudoalteromonas flavipulchra]MBE0373041.1 hypothetical protein [Pseudoalteromonas flavipulchra NCIMB 2033 = ATCC BAA-314]
MLFDYKPNLIHEHTAINTVADSLEEACENLINNNDKKYINDFDVNIGTVVSCLSSSHKLDYVRAIKNKDGQRLKINAVYKRVLKKEHKDAIQQYQSARSVKQDKRDKQNKQDKEESWRPYQIINYYLTSPGKLSSEQKEEGKIAAENLANAFDLVKSETTLKVGQRLYRGLTLTREELDKYIEAEEKDQPLKVKQFQSTSLSESIAQSFAALSYVKKLRNDIKVADNLVNLVLVMTNRRKELPFLIPDILRKPHHNQGQMEILLPNGLELRPTHFELKNFRARIYVDIV